MGLEIEYIDGQTPLDDDEKEGLKIHSITSRKELNEFEQQNIEKAIEWTIKRKFRKEEIFTEKFVRNLHHSMYGGVWKWAGHLRKTEKNIGIEPLQISLMLKKLNDDCLFWIDNSVYFDEEIAIRYKHEIVKIHCFNNGNGRHSRLMADIIISHIFGKPVFSWNRTNLNLRGESRNNYLKALKEADKNNIVPLVEFAKK